MILKIPSTYSNFSLVQICKETPRTTVCRLLTASSNANIAEAHQEVISTEDFIAAFAYSPNPGSNKVVLEIQPFGKYAKVGEDKIDPYQRANLSTTIPNTTCTIDPMLALWKARGFYASAIGLSSPIDDGEGPIDQLSANSSLVAGNLTQFFQNLIRVTSSQTVSSSPRTEIAYVLTRINHRLTC